VAAKPSSYKPCSWAPTLKLLTVYFRKRTLYLLQTEKTKAQTRLNLNITPGFFPPSSRVHTQWLRTKFIHCLFFDIAASIIWTTWRPAGRSSSTA
jgi:hypothetical protein